MTKRVVAVVLACGALGALPAAVAQASAPKAKIPPACVQRTVAKLHFQIGYCP
jgi:hypothetical protein